MGASIGRSVYLPFGHGKIYPNQFIILTGTPGARKGTAISYGKKLLEAMDYKHIAPNKAVKESFWKWMSTRGEVEEVGEEFLDWDVDATAAVNEAYVAHDEFLDFVGVGDDSFITNLANLWDNLPSFTQPKTRGKDITINKPTISILSGMTMTGIAEAFKALAHGGGFFSRVLFIFSAPTKNKITFPSPPNEELGIELVDMLIRIQKLEGELILSEEVRVILDRIYKSCPRMEDGRFEYYSQRRFTHLLKLVIIMAATRESLEPIVEDCILANTLLYNAELSMPDALGEYGKSRYSDITQGILAALNAEGAMNIRAIWKKVRRDLTKFGDLREILEGLTVAEKVQRVVTGDEVLFLADNKVVSKWDEDLIDFTLLHDMEHKL